MSKRKFLIIGSGGQIGTELVATLRQRYGAENVVASDLKEAADPGGPYEMLNALDQDKVYAVVKKYEITDVCLLAALLSATAEKNPQFGWKLNMKSLFIVLEMAKEKMIRQVYWPSSIAVFGPTTPRQNTPQYTIMEPSTVYGISKQTGERWCEWYHKNHGVDVRSIRYPGLIGWKSAPGGGTTDYAVHIYHEALKNKKYSCFLSENTTLPMMYMDDAIRGTIELMEAPAEKVKIRSSYNLSGMSFSPKEIAASIQKHIPDFSISYQPDFRQQIADSWPQSIDDAQAREHWGWKPEYDLDRMTEVMLKNLK
ncbi:MAG: NAD-dependent epimerase/dehydratase family protein [Bacteroidia bacterium]|nr:NAD-dependent epimerase/dehydratase family protein [Bacteroidia bacterium]